MKKLLICLYLIMFVFGSFISVSSAQEIVLSERTEVWEAIIWEFNDSPPSVEFLSKGRARIEVTELSGTELLFLIDNKRRYFVNKNNFDEVMSKYAKEKGINGFYESDDFVIGGLKTRFGVEIDGINNSIMIMNNEFVVIIDVTKEELEKLFQFL